MAKSPLVKGDEVDLGYAAPLRLCPESRDVWCGWLEQNTAFRYESKTDSGLRFSASKDPRGYWSAFKKVDGKLRQKRLGNSPTVAALSPDDLLSVAQGLVGAFYEEDKLLSNPDWVRAELQRLKRAANEAYQRGLDNASESRSKIEKDLQAEIEELKRNQGPDMGRVKKAIASIAATVAEPNGSNKGEKGYQAKSFSKGIADIRAALELLKQELE